MDGILLASKLNAYAFLIMFGQICQDAFLIVRCSIAAVVEIKRTAWSLLGMEIFAQIQLSNQEVSILQMRRVVA